MALSETARLIASLELDPRKFIGGARSAEGAIGRMESRVGGLNSKFSGFAKNLRGGVSGAIATASGRLRGFATAGLGLLGVGGLFSLGAAFKSAVGEAREFGDAVFRVQRITGQSAEATSRLVDALGDFGVDSTTAQRVTGLFEKNIARLAGTQEKASTFAKQYGLNLRDSKGRLLDFNASLLQSADFFNNKAIPASQKAAALAQVYGRSWQTLIPLLAQGRKGLQATLDKSLTLSKEQIAAVEANRIATIKWDDAIGDLKVKIGIGLLPTITELVTTLTGWVNTHDAQIQQFFKDGVATVKSVAGAVVGIVGGIKSAWDAIPGPLRDFLIKGIVVDRTIKFLFGFSVTDLAKGVVGGAAKGLGNALAQAGLGKLFVQPVFVTNQIPGVPGGGAAPVGGKGGGALGLLGAVGIASIVLALAVPVGEELRKWAKENLPKEFVPEGSQSQEAHNRAAGSGGKNVIAVDKKVGVQPVHDSQLYAGEQAGHSEAVRNMATVARRVAESRDAIESKLIALKSATVSAGTAGANATRIGDQSVRESIRANRSNTNVKVNVTTKTNITAGSVSKAHYTEHTWSSTTIGPGHGL